MGKCCKRPCDALGKRIIDEEVSIEVLLVQLLVLVFTGALWWIARRDLAARVPPPVPPAQAADTAELEQLCATLETLATSLARRLDAVEAAQSATPSSGSTASVGLAFPEPVTLPEPISLPKPVSEPQPDPRYQPVYDLLAAGIFDPIEIARQTGLGRGEVDLILSLRGRRAL